MPSYKYRAAHASGKIQKGVMTAANENALAETLKLSGHELISAHKQSLRITDTKLRGWLEKKPNDNQMVTLCGQIADLLRAGVPLLSALNQINSIMPSGKLFDSLRAISQDVAHGMSLAQAFAKHSDLFDAVFLSSLRAGEESGDLAVTFAGLHQHMRWQAKVSAQLRRALRYPAFLLMVAGAAACFMMTMVVPQIVDFLKANQTDLPVITRILISVADIVSAGFMPVLVTIVISALLIPQAKKHSKRFAVALDGVVLAIPLIGNIIHQLSAARFTGSLSLLLKSRMSLPESISIAAGTLQNHVMIAAADHARQRIQDGEPVSKAMAGIFSPFVTQMLVVGEQSGNLGKSLDEITRFYDENAKETVDGHIGTLEPALTLLIGGLLAWIVLAVLGPIYGSIGNMSRVS